MIRSLAVAGALVATAGAVQAQTCIGLPRTSVAPVNITGYVGLPKNATQLGGRLGFGGEAAFGGISVAHTDYDGASDGALSFGGDVGYSIPVNSARTTHICPVVGLNYRNGPNAGNIESTGLGLLAGVALGGEVDVSSTFALVPHASAGVLHLRGTVENTSTNAEVSSNETGGQLGVGLSLRFNRIFSITPSVAIPVGFDGDTDPIFSIGMSLGLRGR